MTPASECSDRSPAGLRRQRLNLIPAIPALVAMQCSSSLPEQQNDTIQCSASQLRRLATANDNDSISQKQVAARRRRACLVQELCRPKSYRAPSQVRKLDGCFRVCLCFGLLESSTASRSHGCTSRQVPKIVRCPKSASTSGSRRNRLVWDDFLLHTPRSMV